MGCRLPGARDVDEFWNLVREGRTAWGRCPEARFNRKLFFHPEKGTLNKSYSDLAALVEYGPIDRALCPVTDAALANFDIAHLTLCEVAAAACRQAGLDPSALPYENTGVYIGHAAASDAGSELTYSTCIAQTARYLREAVGFDQLGGGIGDAVVQEIIDTVRNEQPRGNLAEGSHLGASMAARLISETFALSGPCMSFNAACASSSRALAQAMHALQLGNVDMAIVGGASFFHSDTLVLFSQSQALSATGSRPFSCEADGMVAGEGYVVLLVKMLARAVADKDRILAVIPGIGMSSDGHGKSLWAPRHEGQIKAIQRAYGSQLSISDLQYVEAHATSTSLGDITEMKALSAVLDGRLPPGRKIPAGSAKLNVGHTLESAGLVGVLKVVLALQNEVIPPAVGDVELNPEIDWEASPIYVSRDEIAWPKTDAAPRRAAVNAFGIGGLNVHVVLDEYAPARALAVRGGISPQQTSALPAVKRTEADAVAIIGMGAVMPGALTRDAFWELLTSERDPKIEVPPDRWDADVFHRPGYRERWGTPTKVGGFITGFQYDWRKHKIPPKQIQQASPLQFMMLDAVDQAFQQANYHTRPFNRHEVGVVVGTIFGGDFSGQLVMGLRLPRFQELLADLLRRRGVREGLIAQLSQSYNEVFLKHMPALLDETGSFTASALASRITKTFDLMGGAVAVDAGQASSMAALSCCVDQLRRGECEMMICVGGENDMTPTLFADFSMLEKLATGPIRSPFDVRADGNVPGEGCGALLLKRLADARRDKDPIFGIIRGIGASRDSSPADAARQAIDRALADAGLAPADVSVVETSPSGCRDADLSEIQGIVDGYRGRAAAFPLMLGTVVGQIGDTTGGAGMASLLKAAMEVEAVAMPADHALERVAPHITRHSTVLTVPAHSVQISVSQSDGRLIAGVHSGGKHEVSYHVCLERGSKLKTTDSVKQKTGQPQTARSAAAADADDRIVHFDATQRRREKMRQQALGTKAAARPSAHTENGENGVGHPAAIPAPVRKTAPAAAPVTAAAPKKPPQPAIRPTAPQPAAVSAMPTTRASAALPKATPPKAAPPAATPVPAESNRLNEKELEKFLVNFVVEQTGYPAEIVELDADLEADLGIDSIKKAQLFGELGEYFEVQPSEDLSLDDFPTLRHVLAFLLKSQGTGAAPTASEAAAAPTVAAAARPVAVEPASPRGAARAAAPAKADSARSSAPATTAGPSRLDAQELENFLVNFVVEQTGYPAEIVELDADLEADLGIDSIKKAQLFGELGEYFEVQPSEDLSLDDFPTLRHVLAFLVASQGSAQPASSARPAADPAPESSSRPLAASPAPSPAAPANRNGEHTQSPAPAPAADAPQLDAQELEKFLVNFVVEQTGYPAEIVELDADLEADLGIDSIKKAQLFGELGEYFEVQPSEDLSLDDFPTLRHVLAFLLKSQGSASVSTDRPKASAAPAAPRTTPAKMNGEHTPSPVQDAESPKLDARELEKFLVNFVVEQTGYPAEIVELDADLEADLGIDSIKKAQLFGELGEYFEVQPSEDLSLDDFPTLRHVLAFLLASQGSASASAL